jgi:hypothetical protein
MHASLRPLGAVAALLLGLPAIGTAQIRASETGAVMQVVDGTRFTVQASRPRARGRDPLFGTRAVHWDEVWTPGANWATTFETSKRLTLNGRAVPAGKYSVWFVVRQSGDWTVVLDPTHRIFHMEPPDSNGTQIRFPARVEEAPFTEVLTWSVPEIRASGATLAMNWERKRIALQVEVEPSLQVTLPRAEAEPYLGRYDFVDVTSNVPEHSEFIVSHENGTMKGEWVPADPYMKKFALIRVAPDWFVPGLYNRAGELYEVMRPDLMFTFKRTSGRVTSLELRDEDDKLDGTATRKP